MRDFVAPPHTTPHKGPSTPEVVECMRITPYGSHKTSARNSATKRTTLVLRQSNSDVKVMRKSLKTAQLFTGVGDGVGPAHRKQKRDST
jgi:hypothetical protein